MPEAPVIKVEVSPYGSMTIKGRPNEKDALSFLETHWSELWPKIKFCLEEMSEGCDLSEHLQTPNWKAEVYPVGPKGFMSGEADILVRIILREAPVWDFFLKETKIPHCQPVW